MGSYSVPKEILANKPPGTMIKKISGNYYVYNYTCEKILFTDEQGNTRRKTKTTTGKCIGKMTSEGIFIPNEAYPDYKISVKKYGAYAFAISKSQETLRELKTHFHLEDAKRIYCLALIYLINGFTQEKDIRTEYERSYLSLRFPGLAMGYDATARLLSDLGSRARIPEAFTQDLIEKSSKQLTFDDHVIPFPCGEELPSEHEIRSQGSKDHQLHWLTLYDQPNKDLLLCQFYTADRPDPCLLENLFSRFSFKNTQFNMDRVFYDHDTTELLSLDGNTYILPASAESRAYRHVIPQIAFDATHFFFYKDSTIRYQEMTGPNKERILAYQDLAKASKEQRNFEFLLDLEQDGDPAERLKEEMPFFGLFLFETNHPQLDAKEIFYRYMNRCPKESYFHYAKNKAYLSSLDPLNYFTTQGLSFLTCIAGRIFQNIKNAIGRCSFSNVMDQFETVFIHFEHNKWIVVNTSESIMELSQKFNFDIFNGLNK